MDAVTPENPTPGPRGGKRWRRIPAEHARTIVLDYLSTELSQAALAARYGVSQVAVSVLLRTPSRLGDLADAVAAFRAEGRKRGRRPGPVRGTPKPRRRYTDDQIRAIRKAVREGKSYSTVARRWRCSVPLVQQIVHRVVYGDVVDVKYPAIPLPDPEARRLPFSWDELARDLHHSKEEA